MDCPPPITKRPPSCGFSLKAGLHEQALAKEQVPGEDVVIKATWSWLASAAEALGRDDASTTGLVIAKMLTVAEPSHPDETSRLVVR